MVALDSGYKNLLFQQKPIISRDLFITFSELSINFDVMYNYHVFYGIADEFSNYICDKLFPRECIKFQGD